MSRSPWPGWRRTAPGFEGCGSSSHRATPPCHLCLLDEDRGLLFAGDAIGTQAGRLTQGPSAFIADLEQATRSLHRLTHCRPNRLLCGHGAEIDNPAEALARFVA